MSVLTFRGVPDHYRTSLTKNRLKWPEKRLALFYGPPGGAKTHSAIDLVYRKLKQDGGTAWYITHTGVMGEISAAIERGGSKESVVRALKAVTYLIIDEFLTYNTDLRDTAMAAIGDTISGRIDTAGQQTIVISNSEPAWIAKNVTAGLASRLTEQRGDDAVCEITSVSKLVKPAPLGPLHVLPEPEWMAELQSLASDVVWSVTGEPKTLADIQKSGRGVTWCLADRARNLPENAWNWLQDACSPLEGVLTQLRDWKDDGTVSALRPRPVVSASVATRAAFDHSLRKLEEATT